METFAKVLFRCYSVPVNAVFDVYLAVYRVVYPGPRMPDSVDTGVDTWLDTALAFASVCKILTSCPSMRFIWWRVRRAKKNRQGAG